MGLQGIGMRTIRPIHLDMKGFGNGQHRRSIHLDVSYFIIVSKNGFEQALETCSSTRLHALTSECQPNKKLTPKAFRDNPAPLNN